MPGPHPKKPAGPSEPERRPGQPEQAPPGEPATGFPEPPGPEAEDRARRDPHSALDNPVDEPDPTEWPDPYEERPDPRDEPHPATGSRSTSEPRPHQDPQAEPTEGPKRDKVDE
jgi:hypothetical protein